MSDWLSFETQLLRYRDVHFAVTGGAEKQLEFHYVQSTIIYETMSQGSLTEIGKHSKTVRAPSFSLLSYRGGARHLA